jgi:arylsulfatase A-like enzyme
MTLRTVRRKHPAIPVWLSLLAIGGCLPGVRSWRLDTPSQTPKATVVLLWVDGLDPDRLHDLLAQSRLPNIQRYFVDDGVEFVNTITSLPAITYINAASLFTGCYPPKHGIYGNRWFDRGTLEFRDYDSPFTFALINRDLQRPTIYELISEYRTVSIQCHTHRGAKEGHNNVIRSGLSWLLGRFEWVDRRAAREAEELIDRASQGAQWPALMTVYFPGVDEIAHRHGADSHRYDGAIENVDRGIGTILSAIDNATPPQPLYALLVTDHAQVAAPRDRRVDLVKWLREHRNMHIDEKPPSRWAGLRKPGWPRTADAIAIRDGGRRLVLHLRGHVWRDPVPAEAVRCVLSGNEPAAVALWDAPGVDLVCYKGEGGVHVRSRDGEATIRVRARDGASEYQCETVSGKSPIGAPQDDLAAERWLTANQWLDATGNGPYPNAIPQLSMYFDSGRAGDILIFAAADWVFHPKRRGGHGSAAASDTRVSIFARGPDVAPGRRETPIRLVDLAPTILELLTGSSAHDKRVDKRVGWASPTMIFDPDKREGWASPTMIFDPANEPLVGSAHPTDAETDNETETEMDGRSLVPILRSP